MTSYLAHLSQFSVILVYGYFGKSMYCLRVKALPAFLRCSEIELEFVPDLTWQKPHPLSYHHLLLLFIIHSLDFTPLEFHRELDSDLARER